MARATRSRATRLEGRRASGEPHDSLLARVRQKALERELRRLRQLLELDDTAYSDLFVMQRARQYLAEVLDDDSREEMLEIQELEDDDE